MGGPCSRRGQKLPDEPGSCRPGGLEGFEIQAGGAIGIPVESPFGALNGTFEQDPGAWMPAAELGRTVHVVRKQKVLDRVLARALPPAQVGGGDGVNTRMVRRLERAPLVLRQSMRHGRQDYAGRWTQRGRIGSGRAHREIHPW